MMEMSAEATIAVMENLLKYGKYNIVTRNAMENAVRLLKEQSIQIEKYKFVSEFVGYGFRDWASLIADGKAEAVCNTDEHNRKTTIEFRMI